MDKLKLKQIAIELYKVAVMAEGIDKTIKIGVLADMIVEFAEKEEEVKKNELIDCYPSMEQEYV